MGAQTVLVTGGSGFIGVHCILQLLGAGYRVRATLRSLGRAADVRAMLEAGGAPADERLSFVAADLTTDPGWSEAVAGCRFVLHVASPFPPGVPKNDDELIVPARDGTLRVLAAARDAGVQRVVMTSSFAAIGYGHAAGHGPFSERDWTDAGGADLSAYVKSKTLAERAAWAFMSREGGALQLAVVNPVAVFGPVLGADISTSIRLLQLMLDGGMPVCPRLSFGVVDVRDVADLHLRAMTAPAAAGERFLAVAGDSMSLLEIARVLRGRFGDAARRAPTREIPDWLVRFVATFSRTVAQAVPELGKPKRMSGEKAARVLGWAPRSREEAIIAAADSLWRWGLLKGQRPSA